MEIKVLKNYLFSQSTKLIKTIKNSTILRNRSSLGQDVFEKFKPLIFEKSGSVIEAKNYARVHFQMENIVGGRLSDINNVNRCLCDIYNMNKGKILSPPVIELYKNWRQRYSGMYGSGVISLNTAYNMFPVLAHEIAHYNHEKVSSNYIKMGKKSEIINSGLTDFSIYNKFISNKSALKSIKKEIRGYACSSPAEFVACAFEAIMCKKRLSPTILELYKEYEGPNAEILKQYSIL